MLTERRFSSLEKKTTLVLLIAVGAYALLDLAIQRFVVLPSYEELEAREARRNLSRCIDAIRREMHHLNRFCEDWAAWDDTLEFVEGQRPQFVDENLGLETLIKNECNFVGLFDLQGRLVWGGAYDLQSKTPLAIAELPQQDWPAEHSLLRHQSYNSAITGLLQTSVGPMIVCSRPVTASYVQDRIGGTLILGRLLTADMLQTLRAQTQVDMTLQALVPGMADSEGVPLSERVQKGETEWYEHNEPGELLAYALFQDVYGASTHLLRVRLPKEITARGNVALWTDAFGGMLGGAFTLILLLYMMRRIVAKPLRSLTGQVTAMAERGELSEIKGFPSSDEIGQLAHAFNTMQARVQDTFAEKGRAESAFRDSQSRLGSILNAAPDVILLLDRHGVVQTANAAVRAVLGYAMEEVVGRSFLDFTPPHLRTAVQQAFEDLLLHQTLDSPARTGEFVAQHRDGTEFPVHVAASLAQLDTGLLIALTIRDITELVALHDRIARNQRLAEMGQMSATVAHEIRNPIAGISGAAQVLVNTTPEEHPHRGVLEEMLAQSRRVERTVRQLLGYTRPLKPTLRTVSLSTLARSVLDRLERDGLTTPHRAELKADGPCECAVDDELIAQLLANLIQNAAQSMTQPDVVKVMLSETPTECRIVVEDSGPGFQNLAKAQLFEPFNTTKVQGTGLGLAICNAIAVAHGGSIVLENRVERGARVCVVLPKGSPS